MNKKQQKAEGDITLCLRPFSTMEIPLLSMTRALAKIFHKEKSFLAVC
jgi:hypothetical protein